MRLYFNADSLPVKEMGTGSSPVSRALSEINRPKGRQVMSNKKKEQLGMNPSTASGRLVKDLLWHHVASKQTCHHCKESMTREDFSIEHIEPWLDSEDPLGLYFDMDNVAFSHHSCNVGACRQPRKKYHTDEERKLARAEQSRNYRSRHGHCSTKRRQRYLRTGN